MILSDKNINHLSTIAHEGKVVFFGVDPEGVVWYSVKRSGFEDSALKDPENPFGFDAWKKLILDAAVDDPSQRAHETKNLSDANGNLILYTAYGKGDDVAKTVQAPVQVVSGVGHVLVFRQSLVTNKILVSRFVLDGMKNELVPKLDVRFRRSKKRHEAQPPAGSSKDALAKADGLDFRDIDGNPFFEGATVLNFIPPTSQGRFSVVLVPTNSNDHGRWHIFAFDPTRQKVVLYSVVASEEGLFDPKDQLVGEKTTEGIVYRTVSGIIQRTLDLTGLTVVGRPAAINYDVQSERQTKVGVQLVRDVMRVMLVVPVREANSTTTVTAAVNYQVAGDGMLSQIDLSPDSIDILRSNAREVLLPLTDLDDIKVFGQANPPPAGTIAGIRRGSQDRIEVRATEAFQGVSSNDKVRLYGTRSYDGQYTVTSVNGDVFEIDAGFNGSEPGYWEIVPPKQTGLTFDNMVVGFEKTAAGKLRVRTASHDLKIGDQVQLVGIDKTDGMFTVKVVASDKLGFTLDAPFKISEAVNLMVIKHRGLVFDGVNDVLETPALELSSTAGPKGSFGRTISMWIKAEVLQNRLQHLVGGEDDLLRLVMGADNKVAIETRLSDGTQRSIVDPNPIEPGKWVHYSGTVEYDPTTGGDTKVFLCRNGVKVTPSATDATETVQSGDKIVLCDTPAHLGAELMTLDGADDFLEVAPFASPSKAITVSVWARSATPAWNADGCLVSKRSSFMFNPCAGERKIAFTLWLDNGNGASVEVVPDDIQGWHLYTGTYDGSTIRFYIDGVLAAQTAASGLIDADASGVMRIGHDDGYGPTERIFKGQLAEVQVWSVERTEEEIRKAMYSTLAGTEPNLVGYWPLADRSYADRSTNKRHAAFQGNPVWSAATFRFPAPALGAALAFNSDADSVDTAAPMLAGNSFSLSFWAKCLANTGAQQVIACQGTTETNKGMNVGFRADGRVYFGFGGNDLDAAAIYPNNAWHHYTFTFDRDTLRRVIYRDGLMIAEDTSSAQLGSSGDLRFGRSTFASPLRFAGCLAEVCLWDRALSADEAKVEMFRPVNGNEPGLSSYWTMESGQAGDQGPRKAHGRLNGEPKAYQLAHYIGGAVEQSPVRCFAGEMSDVRIWDRAMSDREVRDTMNLTPTGKENDLAGYYRMGGIVPGDPALVPDFALHGRHATVHGEPYAGARTLARATGAGAMAVKYSNSALVAVRQLGTYEETFEFRVLGPNPNLDPNNVDGLGNRLFAFSAWGKSSLLSEEVIELPAGAVRQTDFQNLGNGFYRASCRMTVPEGVSMLRVFELKNVRGLWRTGATPPAEEWTHIEIRRHKLRLVSDTVSRETYTDVIAPVKLTSLETADASLREAEGRVATYKADIIDLTLRLDVAQYNAKYLAEKNTLGSQMVDLQNQYMGAESALAYERDNLRNYRFTLRNRANGGELMVGSGEGQAFIINNYDENNKNAFMLNIRPIDGTWGHLARVGEGGTLSPSLPWFWGMGGLPVIQRSPSDCADWHMWRMDRVSPGVYHIVNKYSGCLLEVPFYFTGRGIAVSWLPYANNDFQRWTVPMRELTAAGAQVIQSKQYAMDGLKRTLNEKQARLNYLTKLLATPESANTVQGLLTTAQNNLNTARADFTTRNNALLATIANTGGAVTMPVVQRDDRNLRTDAGLLDFVRPIGGISIAATSEGNVQLDYVDSRGRLRNVVYDAAADSRNSTFEQWLPNVVGVCIDCANTGSMLTPAKPIALPGDGYSFETWFQYPLATKADGTPFARNVFAGSSDNRNSPICVQDGNKLGVLVDNMFLDSGVRLDRELIAGWHHLVAVGLEGRTDFYLNGVLSGTVDAKRHALRFDGVDDFVEIAPSGATFAQGISVEAWVYLETPGEASDWRAIFTEVHTGDPIQFALWVGDADHKLQAGFWDGAWYQAKCSSGLPLNRWVHVAATYDNNNVRIYIDGVLVSTSGNFNRGLPASASQWRMGRRHDTGNAANLWKGKISEVRLWEKVLAEYDIKDGMSRSFSGKESNLVGYWVMETFEKDGVTQVKDKSAKEKHGVLKSGPTVEVMLPQCTSPITCIGNMPQGGSPIGRLSEVGIWHATLSPAEIECMSKMRSSGFEPGLMAFWPLGETGGTTAFDHTGENHLQVVLADRVICSANIGSPVNIRKPNTSTLGDSIMAFDGTNGKVAISGIDLSNKSFTIEFWAQRPRLNTEDYFVRQGVQGTDTGLHVGFRAGNTFTFAFWGDDIDTTACGDWGWHHWACVFDASTKAQRIYRDGALVASRTATGTYKGTGEFAIGMAPASFTSSTSIARANMGELRIWTTARTAQDIADNMRKRLAGNETGLLGYWPLSAIESDNKTKDLTAAARHGVVSGGATITKSSESLIAPLTPPPEDPIVTTDVICADYPTVGVSAAGAKEAYMRRCIGFVQDGQARFLYDARIEPLILQWVGNCQFKPTLLGYIEGAPPVPSENLTMQEDYAGATSVQLVQSENTTYSWQRSDNVHGGLSIDAFIGAAWSVSAGVGVETKLTEGKAGAKVGYSFKKSTTRTSAVRASNTVTMSDSLTLRGALENDPTFPHLGRRFVPKNVGYALVISGLADVFITKLARSGRMVGYEVKPVDGVPLDVNTITFLINPAYQLNGSLDGMVGSFAADKRFYDHVPAMRAQYGALYPASYYRLKEAYDIAAEIERKDKARETYFMNFDIGNMDIETSGEDINADGQTGSGIDDSANEDGKGDSSKAKSDAKAQEKKKKEEGEKRKAAIQSQISGMSGQVRAKAAFAEWQQRMENILIKAGKRNIVNKYVWDADGGLRAEEQSFSASVEHTVGGEVEHEGNFGGQVEASVAAFRLELTLMGSAGSVASSEKGLTSEKSMELSVDLSGLESRGITKLDDMPCMPGEKVDRYRFMTFYLEPQAKHFEDFFRTVVDPEWLMSNDEEARALRQTQAGKPNRCWRIMHRVTYVERPALMAAGQDVRALPGGAPADKQMTDYFEGLETKQRLLSGRLDDLEGKLDQILAKLP